MAALKLTASGGTWCRSCTARSQAEAEPQELIAAFSKATSGAAHRNAPRNWAFPWISMEFGEKNA